MWSLVWRSSGMRLLAVWSLVPLLATGLAPRAPAGRRRRDAPRAAAAAVGGGGASAARASAVLAGAMATAPPKKPWPSQPGEAPSE